MFTPARTEHNSLFARVAAWWGGLRRRRIDLRQLENSGEIESIAADAGLSTSELRRLVGGGSDAAELKRRMAALGIDPERFFRNEPAVARDLQRACSLCTSKRRCRHDLTARPGDPRWQEYCPNSHTLNALRVQ
jgi:hypothetical protein